ncbi:hypothetical protein ACFP82_00125 [Cellulomonas gelida]|uniref:hypothetical protein n=1 Tax=Cellulomonas gelida TaxID=1712 RepID=UPI00362068CA
MLASGAGLQSCLIGPRTRVSMVLSGAGGDAVTSWDVGAQNPGTAETAPDTQASVGVVGPDATPTADGATYATGGIEGSAPTSRGGTASGASGRM